MGRYKEAILWTLVIVFIMLSIFNMLQIGRNYRRIDFLIECQTWLFEHPDNYWPVINIIMETQNFILELLDGLIEPKKNNYTLY